MNSTVIDKVRRNRGWVITLIVVGSVLFFVSKGLIQAKADNITCDSAPEGYVLVNNVMATNLSNQSFFIVRAIVNYGDGSLAGKSAAIQACTTSDKSLQNVGGVFAYIDGRFAFIASGVIGVSSSPLASMPQQ